MLVLFVIGTSDVGSIIPTTNRFCRFFNPRTDLWSDHFQLVNERIEPLTDIGKVTVRILQFNSHGSLLERQILISEGRYPPDAAEPLVELDQ